MDVRLFCEVSFIKLQSAVCVRHDEGKNFVDEIAVDCHLDEG